MSDTPPPETQPFAMVPKAVLALPGLALGTKVVYAVLRGFAFGGDECRPSNQAIADAAGGGSLRWVQTALAELQAAELIRCEGKPGYRERIVLLPVEPATAHGRARLPRTSVRPTAHGRAPLPRTDVRPTPNARAPYPEQACAVTAHGRAPKEDSERLEERKSISAGAGACAHTRGPESDCPAFGPGENSEFEQPGAYPHSRAEIERIWSLAKAAFPAHMATEIVTHHRWHKIESWVVAIRKAAAVKPTPHSWKYVDKIAEAYDAHGVPVETPEAATDEHYARFPIFRAPAEYRQKCEAEQRDFMVKILERHAVAAGVTA